MQLWLVVRPPYTLAVESKVKCSKRGTSIPNNEPSPITDVLNFLT